MGAIESSNQLTGMWSDGCPVVPDRINNVQECEAIGSQFFQCKQRMPGRRTVVGSFGWVPYGCSYQRNGDWTLHWNLDPNGKDTNNDYGFLGSPTTTEITVPNLKIPVDIPDMNGCQKVGALYLQKKKVGPGRGIQSGGWDHVPGGCSVQSGSGGDWAIHWNSKVNPSSPDNAMYTFLGKPAGSASGSGSTPAPPTQNTTSCPSMPASLGSENECFALANQWIKCQNQTPAPPLSGSWNWVPYGCSVYNATPHWNTDRNAVNNGKYTLLASGPPLPVCPSLPDRVESQEACNSIANQWLRCKNQNPKPMISGSFGWVPYGCSVYDSTPHWNTDRNAVNNGKYTPLAAGPALPACPSIPERIETPEACNNLANEWMRCKNQNPKAMLSGKWGWVPYGCSVYDSTPHWNSDRNGNDTKGQYTLLAPGPALPACPSLPERVDTPEACNSLANEWMSCKNQNPKPMLTGNWNWVPYGCSVYDSTPHWNTDRTAVNNGKYTPLASGPAPPPCPSMPERIDTFASCVDLGSAYLTCQGTPPTKQPLSGAWGWAPYGCSVYDGTVHWNTNYKGKNNGKYVPLAPGPVVQGAPEGNSGAGDSTDESGDNTTLYLVLGAAGIGSVLLLVLLAS